MPLTEEEARTKWCPMARVPILDCSRAIPVTVAANRDHYGDPTASGCCIASDCMLWERVLARDDKRPESSSRGKSDAHPCL